MFKPKKPLHRWSLRRKARNVDLLPIGLVPVAAAGPTYLLWSLWEQFLLLIEG